MITIRRLPREEIEKEWNSLKGFIDTALTQSKCDDYGLKDVYHCVNSGQWTLWSVKDDDKYCGAVVVDFIHYPNGTVAYICAVGGYMLSNKEVVKDFFEQLKKAGAQRVQGAARPSIVRLWRRIGLEEKYAIVEGQL